MSRFDVAVIGLGPGGEDVAGRLAEHGLSVLAVESRLVGGECPYWGCIPTKMMVRAASTVAESRRGRELAGLGNPGTPGDWAPVARRIREVATDSWDDATAMARLTDRGVTVRRGHGRLHGRGQVDVDGTLVSLSRGIVIATGTVPTIPDIPGMDRVDAWTNHDLVEAETLPRSMVILGGGAIGCEFAQILSRFGVRVTLVEQADHILPSEDPDIATALTSVLAEEGITIRTGARVRQVAPTAPGVTVTLGSGESLTAERLLIAVGRRADLPGVGLDKLGVATNLSAVQVDDRCRVSKGVWAVGDITGCGAFTHVSMYQADIVLRHILGRPGPAADYRAVPRVTFTEPEVASVGMTERQATGRGIRVRVGRVDIPDVSRGWIHGPGNDGLVKLVLDADHETLVGASLLSPAGGEVIGLLTLAVHARVRLDQLTSMLYAFPTFHRSVLTALSNLSDPPGADADQDDHAAPEDVTDGDGSGGQR